MHIFNSTVSFSACQSPLGPLPQLLCSPKPFSTFVSQPAQHGIAQQADESLALVSAQRGSPTGAFKSSLVLGSPQNAAGELTRSTQLGRQREEMNVLLKLM